MCSRCDMLPQELKDMIAKIAKGTTSVDTVSQEIAEARKRRLEELENAK